MKTSYKTLLAATLTGTLLLTLTGCSSKSEPEAPEQGECVIAGVEGPDWACGTYKDDKAFTATGSAKISRLGHGFTRREALAVARSNLAQQIETDIKDKVETFMRATGIASSEVTDKVVNQVSRQTARVTLADSKQIAYWENSGDESIYVLVSVGREQVNRSVKNGVVSSFRNEAALWQQFQAQNALDGLEKEFPTP